MPYFQEIPQTVTAIIARPNQFNGKELSQDKEMISAHSLIVKDGEGLHEAVTVRVWMGKSRNANRAYATIWAHDQEGHLTQSGHGWAGGYGYHRSSAAVAEAVKSAGFDLYGNPYARENPDLSRPFDFAGTGDSAYPEILAAIARAMGWNTKGAMLVRHG